MTHNEPAIPRRPLALVALFVVALAAASTATGAAPIARAGSVGDSDPKALIDAGGTLFFTARDPGHGRELWKSDGTAEGTRRVRDIRPGSASSYIRRNEMVAIGETLFFRADDGVHGSDLWVSDGTRNGTTRVLPELAEGLDPRQLTNVDGTLYFIANRRELWKSDGTPAGTALIEVLPSLDRYLAQLTAVGPRLYFVVVEWDENQVSLWKSDGTAGTTGPVEIVSTKAHIAPVGLTAAGDLLFFGFSNFIPDAPPSGVLWRSNGTAAGTRQIFDVHVDGYDDGIVLMLGFESKLMFGAAGGDEDGLWKTAGTTASTRRITTAQPSGSFADVDGLLYFLSGNRLWTTDGSRAGTQPVERIRLACCDHAPWVGMDGVLYFSGESASGDAEPWRSDGTAEGTYRLANLSPTGSSNPTDMTISNGTLFFAADDGTHGQEIWMSDGTPTGTVLVEDIVP